MKLQVLDCSIQIINPSWELQNFDLGLGLKCLYILYYVLYTLDWVTLFLIHGWQEFYYIFGAGRLSTYGHGMGKMTHGRDGSIEKKV